jgi:transcriptional regulator with XRE-family HTH domain
MRKWEAQMQNSTQPEVLDRMDLNAKGNPGRGPVLPTAKASTPVDVHIGQRLRMRRKLLGMSQEQLSDRVGVTFQQVQKYEKGTNRISASRLFGIAQVLSVPVSYFFEGLATSETEMDHVIPMTHEEQELLLAFRDARQEVRNHLIALVQASREQPERASLQRTGRLRQGRRPLRHQKVARSRQS